MTYQNDCTLPNEILEQIAEQGLDYLPELIRVVVNAAMKAERQQYLGVAPYERSEQRRDQANGFKPKTVRTRMGEIEFAIPQVRAGEYYPQALEKGLRSERALTMALADRRRSVATLSISPPAKCPSLCAAQRHAGGSGRRYPQGVQRSRPSHGRHLLETDRSEVRAERFPPGRLDGNPSP